MQNAGHKAHELSGSQQNQGAGAQGKARFRLEAIIALQKALQNGIPEHDGDNPKPEDKPGLVAGEQDGDEHVGSRLLFLNPLMLFLADVRQLLSAAARPNWSGSRARQTPTAHLGAP
jgi:hypothetical protein